MSEPRVQVVNRSGGQLSEFIGANVSEVVWKLNEPEQFSIEIDPIRNASKTFALVKNEVQVWDDDDLIAWGVPWRYSGDMTKITIYCEGLGSYFRKRIIDDATLIYTSVEQRTIGWNLVQYAQSVATQANRNLNINSAVFAGTTHIRSRQYDRADHAFIFDLLTEFTELEDGFDWAIISDATGQRLWTPFYPQRGSLKKNMKLVWKADGTRRDMLKFSVEADGLGITTHAYVTGGSNGGVKFEQNVENVPASVEYGVMQSVVSEGSQNDVTWLNDKATREVNLRKKPIFIPTCTVPRFIRSADGTVVRDYLKDCSEGDTLPILIDAGIIQADISERIKTKTWRPATDEIELTFNEGA